MKTNTQPPALLDAHILYCMVGFTPLCILGSKGGRK